jgi:palmitoyltransferase
MSSADPSSSVSGTAPQDMTAPMQPSTKSAAAAPTLNNDMEMGAVGDARAQPQENDIMQLARVGDVAGMEKLFESGEYDATYTDDEGITPLHVRPHFLRRIESCTDNATVGSN